MKPWNHSTGSSLRTPAAEMTLWLAQTTASGMVPWFHWLGGSPEDQRWRQAGRSFYQWLATHEVHFRNQRSIADLAVVYPQNTIAFERSRNGRRQERAAEHLQGLYYALLEGRFVFD